MFVVGLLLFVCLYVKWGWSIKVIQPTEQQQIYQLHTDAGGQQNAYAI